MILKGDNLIIFLSSAFWGTLWCIWFYQISRNIHVSQNCWNAACHRSRHMERRKKGGSSRDIPMIAICYVNVDVCKDTYLSASCRLIAVILPGSRAFGPPLHTAFVTWINHCYTHFLWKKISHINPSINNVTNIFTEKCCYKKMFSKI